MSKSESSKAIYIRFWEKVQSSIAFKIIFALLSGLFGVFLTMIASIIFLLQAELKWVILLNLFGFMLGVIICPFQYKNYSARYRKYVEYHKSKDMDSFMQWINR